MKDTYTILPQDRYHWMHGYIPPKAIRIIISGLRTGYSHLNKYRHNLGQTESPFCICVLEEYTDHFLFDCLRYEYYRIRMFQRLWQELGIQETTTEELMATDKKFNELKPCYEILGTNILAQAETSCVSFNLWLESGPPAIVELLKNKWIIYNFSQ